MGDQLDTTETPIQYFKQGNKVSSSKKKDENHQFGLTASIDGGPARDIWFSTEQERNKALKRLNQAPNSSALKLD